MQINSLLVSCLRNLHSIDLSLNTHFNIFYGDNGSGKTSLLEAIHVLTTGKSFRAHPSRQIITFGKKSCMVSALVVEKVNGIAKERDFKTPIRLGIERLQTGGIKIRIAEQDCQSIAELAKTLPLQLINSDSYAILEATPQYRRQFLDWVMFHVEHSFYPVWQRFKRALQQRNAALKSAPLYSVAQIRIWDKELVEAGEMIDSLRRTVLSELVPIVQQTVRELLKINTEIVIEYLPGWDTDQFPSLQNALDASFERDRSWSYTTLGPQRADLEFRVGGVPAKNLLSRGQSKLFICALLMARATLLYQRKERRCVVLIDDLNAELDREASRLLLSGLKGLGCQILMTCIEGKSLAELLELEPDQYSVFQVKNGQISVVKETVITEEVETPVVFE